jgi:cathepsin B
MRILTNFDEIKAELVTNGPMMVGFTIYEDFMSYSTGEYHPTTTKIVGGHAVKLLGWGYDSNNKLYWLCQNQWGTGWGLSGFFKIQSGSAGIDSAAFACIPDI